MNRQNDQYEFTISNGFPPQGHVASPTSGQQLDPVYRDNYMEKQRRLQEENYRRAQAQALAAKQETQRQLEQERQRQLEQERQRQFEQERQRQLEQEGIMRENARLEEQRKLHAKAIEDARALEAKRQALVAEEERKRERERARRNYVCLLLLHLFSLFSAVTIEIHQEKYWKLLSRKIPSIATVRERISHRAVVVQESIYRIQFKASLSQRKPSWIMPNWMSG